MSQAKFYASTFTPFNEKGEVDCTLIDEYIKFLAKVNVDGISVLGISGEGTSMTMDERKKTAEKFVSAAKANKIEYINVHVTCMSIADTQELAMHAETIGANTVSILPNLFHKPTCSMDVIDYIKEIAGCLKSTNVMYVNIPELTNVYIRMTEVLTFGAEIPRFGGIHDSGMDMTDLSRAIWTCKTNPKLSVLCSRNVDIVPALAIGCKRFVSPSINFCLPIYRKIAEKYKTDEGLEVQLDVLNALAVCCKYGLNVAMLKACTEKVGNIELGGVRKPLKSCPPNIIEALDMELNAMNFWQQVKINENDAAEIKTNEINNS